MGPPHRKHIRPENGLQEQHSQRRDGKAAAETRKHLLSVMAAQVKKARNAADFYANFAGAKILVARDDSCLLYTSRCV